MNKDNLAKNIHVLYSLAVTGRLTELQRERKDTYTESYLAISEQAVSEVCQLFADIGLFDVGGDKVEL